MITINRNENFQIRVLGRIAYEYCKHWLIAFDCCNHTFLNHPELVRKEITLDNINDCKIFDYRMDRIYNYLTEQKNFFEGFLFYNKQNNIPVACIWIAYKGANEFQYRIRYIDAFGFNFAVREGFRGRGIIGFVIHDVMEYLLSKGIHTLYASVRTNNDIALKAYRKLGIKIIKQKRFFRIGGIRIPYPII